MNAEQMQKWGAIRQKGRESFLLKRTLLWGMVLSLAEIAFSSFTRFIIATPIVNTFYYATHSKERTVDTETVMTRFIINEFFGVIGCFLLAGFIALAVWTYKEQSYYTSTTFEANQN
jgi:hypothetical protein